MSITGRIFQEAKRVYSTYFEVNDQLLSAEIKEILEDPVKRENYFNALDELKQGATKNEKGVEIELSEDRKITITLNH